MLWTKLWIVLTDYVRYLNHIRYTVPETYNYDGRECQIHMSPIIQYNMRVAAILTFDKCPYLRGRLWLTTARLV